MSRRVDLAGQRFGRLLVTAFAGINKDRAAQWVCQCDCGETRVIRSNSLRTGSTQSCGCLQREVAATGDCRRTHGMSKTPLYGVWCNMWTRGDNPNYKQAADYSERGISVDPEWAQFEKFLEDMPGYAPGLTLERKDVDKGYCKDNCEWATRKVQSLNKRTTKKFMGKPLLTWAEELGINYYTLYSRLKRYGTIFPDHLPAGPAPNDATRKRKPK